jgi:hypothetical protein
MGMIWNGTTPEGPGECVVVDGPPDGHRPHSALGYLTPTEFAARQNPK